MSHTLHHEPDGGSRTLVDALLEEQRSLTAVERFALAHKRHELPAKQKQYRNLLPTAAPAPGQQFAFEVDLDKCSGCKACVTACHSLNGLDDDETWRSVGLLISPEDAPLADGQPAYRAAQSVLHQHVTTACHHCVDPGCLNGCPVLAYDKDPVTGIVRHLDDQCIGCQYCVMKCPYEVPRYSKARGIVRKCDMCSSRLAVGEAPACVQACPNEAIKITLVGKEWTRLQWQTGPGGKSSSGKFLPASPDPTMTLPTTRYLSARSLPIDLLAGDDAVVRPAPAHLPLAWLLVLTQLAVGAGVASLFARNSTPLLFLAFFAGGVGLVAGTLHLGQPLKAWRAFLGWRKSWFSREVIVFGAFVPLSGLALVAQFGFSPLSKPFAFAAGLTGLVGVFCSVMIYADTRREFWSVGQSFVKFFGTTLFLGLMAVLAFDAPRSGMLAALVAVSAAVKLAFEHRIFRWRLDNESLGQPPLSKTALLLTRELGGLARARIACGLLGGIALPVTAFLVGLSAVAFAAFALCVTGELLERHLFFVAVAARKMPGGLAA